MTVNSMDKKPSKDGFYLLALYFGWNDKRHWEIGYYHVDTDFFDLQMDLRERQYTQFLGWCELPDFPEIPEEIWQP